MENSFGIRRIKHRTTHGKVPGMGLALAIEQELIEGLPPIVQKIREPAKVIAFRLGKTPRCIEGARQGEHLTSLPVALALGKLYPEVRQYLNSLMDAETGDSGDDPSRVLSEIQRLLNQRG